jgi:hypothetical protein
VGFGVIHWFALNVHVVSRGDFASRRREVVLCGSWIKYSAWIEQQDEDAVCLIKSSYIINDRRSTKPRVSFLEV